jgi:hypothetical protein
VIAIVIAADVRRRRVCVVERTIRPFPPAHEPPQWLAATLLTRWTQGNLRYSLSYMGQYPDGVSGQMALPGEGAGRTDHESLHADMFDGMRSFPTKSGPR